MRQYTKIIIDGLEADLPDDFSFTLTYAIRDREGFASNTGTRSEYAFSLPSTKQNDLISKLFWKPNTDNAAAQTFRPAQILINGREFFTGKAQLEKTTTKGSNYSWQAKEHEYAFYGNNSSWINEIKDRKIRDYDFLDHVLDSATVSNAFNQQAGNNFFCYMVIKLKDWVVPGQVAYYECTPGIFVADIFTQLLQEIGYTLNSTFLTSTVFNKLVIPILLPEKYPQEYSEDYLNTRATIGTTAASTFVGLDVIFPTQTKTPPIGANPYDTATGEYTCPADGFYKMSSVIQIENIVGTIDFAVAVLKNGAQEDITGTPSITTNRLFEISYVVEASAGDVLTIQYLYFPGMGASADFSGSFSVIGEQSIKAESEIRLKYLIPPQWTVLGLIKGLSQMFNLVWQTDEAQRIITVEPSDSYIYSDRGTPPTLHQGFYGQGRENKTPKLDLGKDGELLSNTDRDRVNILKYKNDSSDPTIDGLNELSELPIHSAQYTFPSNIFKDDENEVENDFFAPTLTYFANEVRSSTSTTTPVFPIIWPEDFNETPTAELPVSSYEPRILIFDRIGITTDDEAGLFQFYQGGVSANPIKGPIAYMIDYNDTTGQTFSLSFATKTIQGNERLGLLQRFYIRQFARYRGAKEAEAWIFWNATELANLDFRKYITINEAEYILQEVRDFNPLDKGSTRTYLLYNEEDNQDDIDSITNTSIEGTLVQN